MFLRAGLAGQSYFFDLCHYFYFIPPSSLLLRANGNFSGLTTSLYDDFAT